MRVLKGLLVRFLLVFLACLLLSLLTHHHSPGLSVAVLDRRYQLTLHALRTRGPIQYTDYKTKTVQWAALSNQTLCLSGVENKVALQPCTSPSPFTWTLHQSRNPDKRDKLVLNTLNKCVDVGAVTQPRGTPLIVYACHGGVSQEVSYDFTSKMIYHGESNNCVEIEKEEGGESVVKVKPCNLKKREQKWSVTVLEENVG